MLSIIFMQRLVENEREEKHKKMICEDENEVMEISHQTRKYAVMMKLQLINNLSTNKKIFCNDENATY